jgi:hypothetical protein
VTVQEHFIAYCRCREAVKLFRFLQSPVNLIGTYNSVQNCTFADWHIPTERSGVCMDLCIVLVFLRDVDVSEEYGITQKPVNWLVNCTLKYIRNLCVIY